MNFGKLVFVDVFWCWQKAGQKIKKRIVGERAGLNDDVHNPAGPLKLRFWPFWLTLHSLV